MIPAQNASHVVLSFPFERITDLIEASRDAGVLPRKEPPNGGWDELELPVPRLDLRFRFRFRAELGPLKIDGWQSDAADEFRLGAAINLIAFTLEAFEISTGVMLADLDYALSGRVYISGSLELRPNDKALFFVLRRVRATFDDSTAGLPTPWPELDLEEILNRIADRVVRAQLAVKPSLPERSMPLNPELETGGLVGVPLVLGFALRDRNESVDWLSRHVCLPPHMGDPHCAPGNGTTLRFYDRLDVFGAPQGTPAPDHANLVGRQFQIDIGIDLLRRALAAQRDSSWSGDKKFGPFRFQYDLNADIRPWPGTNDGSAGIWFQFKGKEQVWYPKVKMCHGWTDTPFGRWEYDYPCGFEDGWLDTQTVTIEVMFRLIANNDRICIERTQLRFDVDQNLWGRLYEFIVTALIGSIPIVGPIVSAAVVIGEMLVFIVLMIAALIGRIVDAVLPTQVCASLAQTFARLPLIDDRVDVLLSNAFLWMQMSGTTIAFDGDFEKR